MYRRYFHSVLLIWLNIAWFIFLTFNKVIKLGPYCLISCFETRSWPIDIFEMRLNRLHYVESVVVCSYFRVILLLPYWLQFQCWIKTLAVYNQQVLLAGLIIQRIFVVLDRGIVLVAIHLLVYDVLNLLPTRIITEVSFNLWTFTFRYLSNEGSSCNAYVFLLTCDWRLLIIFGLLLALDNFVLIGRLRKFSHFFSSNGIKVSDQLLNY